MAPSSTATSKRHKTLTPAVGSGGGGLPDRAT